MMGTETFSLINHTTGGGRRHFFSFLLRSDYEKYKSHKAIKWWCVTFKNMGNLLMGNIKEKKKTQVLYTCFT